MQIEHPVKVATLTMEKYVKLREENETFFQPGSLLSFDKVYHCLTKTFPSQFSFVSNIRLYSNKKIVNSKVTYIVSGKQVVVEQDQEGYYPVFVTLNCFLEKQLIVQVELESAGFLQIVYDGVVHDTQTAFKLASLQPPFKYKDFVDIIGITALKEDNPSLALY